MKLQSNLPAWLCVAQGAYFLATGIWPLVSIDTFQLVTGPKTDLWLVKTVGVLVGVIGVALLLAARHPVERAVLLLAMGSAAGLLLIDVIYVSARVIAPIYLADAAIQLALLICWAATSMRR